MRRFLKLTAIALIVTTGVITLFLTPKKAAALTDTSLGGGGSNDPYGICITGTVNKSGSEIFSTQTLICESCSWREVERIAIDNPTPQHPYDIIVHDRNASGEYTKTDCSTIFLSDPRIHNNPNLLFDYTCNESWLISSHCPESDTDTDTDTDTNTDTGTGI